MLTGLPSKLLRKRSLIDGCNVETIHQGTMAVLPSLPGIIVTVSVNNRGLQEFPDDEEPGVIGAELATKTISKYVQSVPKEFSIVLRVTPQFKFDFPTIGFHVYVDGAQVAQPIARKAVFEAKKGYLRIINGIKYAVADGEEQKCVFHNFRFSVIETSESLRTVQRRINLTDMSTQPPRTTCALSFLEMLQQ
jgi:hypothetical protein